MTRFFNGTNAYTSLFPNWLDADKMQDIRFVLPFLILILGVCLFFAAALILLVFVQTFNFIHGKTTMERFGRSGHDTDHDQRMMNSGIKDDAQVFRASSSRVNSSSFPNRNKNDKHFPEVDPYEEHSIELESRLISTEIANNPNSSNDKIAHSNYKQMLMRNRR